MKLVLSTLTLHSSVLIKDYPVKQGLNIDRLTAPASSPLTNVERVEG